MADGHLDALGWAEGPGLAPVEKAEFDAEGVRSELGLDELREAGYTVHRAKAA